MRQSVQRIAREIFLNERSSKDRKTIYMGIQRYQKETFKMKLHLDEEVGIRSILHWSEQFIFGATGVPWLNHHVALLCLGEVSMSTSFSFSLFAMISHGPCFYFRSVLTDPAFISRGQLDQMKKILFTHRDDRCEYSSVNHKGSVARPIQPHRGRLLHKCTESDYVSDKKKKEMRLKTGNPDWCC